VAGLLAGVAPAWQQTRDYVLGALSETGARIAGGRGHRLRRVLVTGELSLAVVLLIGSGLMIKGFATLLSANPSFAPDSLVTMHVNLPPERYGESNQAKAFSDQLLSRLQSLPAVESASLAKGCCKTHIFEFALRRAGISLGRTPLLAASLASSLARSNQNRDHKHENPAALDRPATVDHVDSRYLCSMQTRSRKTPMGQRNSC
jgi:hypothetical protein